MPGLVNCHTHLELTGFAGRVGHDRFFDWIMGLRRLKETRSHAEFLAAAREGVRSCWRSGVTTVADTGDSGAAIEALNQLGGSGLVYHEVFGPHPDQCQESISSAALRLDELTSFAGDRVRLGLSPHAPYSVSGPLYRAVADLARSRGLPLAVHIAESEAESLLLAEGEGPFAEAWQGRGIPLPAPQGDTPLGWLDRHGVLGPDLLCIHAIELSRRDLSVLRESGARVAHCPRSNQRHHHRRAPLAELLRLGVPVGVGTDSEVSLAHPDLLAEARAAGEIAGLTAEAALALATTEAAAALNLGAEVGAIAPGMWGDLVAVRLPHTDESGLAKALLQSSPNDIELTVVAGRVVYRRETAG